MPGPVTLSRLADDTHVENGLPVVQSTHTHYVSRLMPGNETLTVPEIGKGPEI